MNFCHLVGGFATFSCRKLRVQIPIEADHEMTDKTLFLAWQDKFLTHEWFPVGRLDISDNGDAYRFRYIKGAEPATELDLLHSWTSPNGTVPTNPQFSFHCS